MPTAARLYHDGVALAGTVLPLVGVVVLGWSPAAVLGIYLVELCSVCFWTVLQVPFATKRPNNALDEGFELLGPLQAKRGGTPLPGPFPPVYLRNVPVLVTGLVLTPVVAGLGFVLFALTRPTITESVAATILLGGSVAFLSHGATTWRQYFRDGGYREHSPRSVLLTPFKSLWVVGILFVVFLALEASRALPNSRIAVIALALGKLGYEVRTRRIDRDDGRRSLFAKLYGSKRTEVDPVPIQTPDSDPVERVSMSRSVAVVDALGHGFRYGFLKLGIFVWGAVALGASAGSPGIVAAGLGLGVGFGSIRATTRYLRYGTVEYRCHPDVIVAYDTLLDEPQARMVGSDVAGATAERGLLDRLLGTETLDFEVVGADEQPSFDLIVPEDPDTEDDADESIPLSMPHLAEPTVVTDVLQLTWMLDGE